MLRTMPSTRVTRRHVIAAAAALAAGPSGVQAQPRPPARAAPDRQGRDPGGTGRRQGADHRRQLPALCGQRPHGRRRLLPRLARAGRAPGGLHRGRGEGPGQALPAHRPRKHPGHRAETPGRDPVDGPLRPRHGDQRLLHCLRRGLPDGRPPRMARRQPGLRRLRPGDRGHGRGADHPGPADWRPRPEPGDGGRDAEPARWSSSRRGGQADKGSPREPSPRP